MALVLPRGEIFLWGRNFWRIILGILAALLAAKIHVTLAFPNFFGSKFFEKVRGAPHGVEVRFFFIIKTKGCRRFEIERSEYTVAFLESVGAAFFTHNIFQVSQFLA